MAIVEMYRRRAAQRLEQTESDVLAVFFRAQIEVCDACLAMLVAAQSKPPGR